MRLDIVPIARGTIKNAIPLVAAAQAVTHSNNKSVNKFSETQQDRQVSFMGYLLFLFSTVQSDAEAINPAADVKQLGKMER